MNAGFYISSKTLHIAISEYLLSLNKSHCNNEMVVIGFIISCIQRCFLNVLQEIIYNCNFYLMKTAKHIHFLNTSHQSATNASVTKHFQ